MKFSPLLISLLFCALLAQTAHAENLKTKLEAEQSLQKERELELKSIESDLEKTGKNLVGKAKDIQVSEKTLIALDRKIENLEHDQDRILTQLKTGQNSMARLLMALERLRRMPPEALVLKPGKPLETAQSALLLKEVMPALQQQADTLNQDLKKLSFITKDLKEQKSKALEENTRLLAEQKELHTLVEQRKTLYASVHKDLKEQQDKIRHISAQSNTLSELVNRLDDFRRKPKPEKQDVSLKAPKAPPRSGAARLPVSGAIVRGFNDPDDFGAPSQGIDIEARGGALVVAPMGGVVRFAGHFKNYGNMVILEHEGGWHSLVAGLEKIDTVVGQSVSAGEPLGLLNKSSGSNKPRLYYELRQNGKPVNPSKKFSDLS